MRRIRDCRHKRKRRSAGGPIRWGEVWDSGLVPLLRSTPGYDRSPSSTRSVSATPRSVAAFAARMRRIRTWRALTWRRAGPSSSGSSIRRVRLGLSNFTDMRDHGVGIAGVPLDHRLYHFRLAFIRWEHAHIVLGGECLGRWPRTTGWEPVGLRCASQRQPRGRVRQSRCRHAAGPDASVY